MVEQGNTFTKTQADLIREQVQKDKMSDSDLILSTLVTFLGRKKIIPLDELSEKIVPHMDLEPAEIGLLKAGFSLRIMRLSSLYHSRLRRASISEDPNRVIDDPKIISRSIKKESKINDLIDASITNISNSNLQIHFDSDSAKNWLKRAFNSGINLAACIYDDSGESEGLKLLVEERKNQIASSRNLVPEKIRELINVDFRSLNF
jgi:hypothetical protein